jgi:hypothetical protein
MPFSACMAPTKPEGPAADVTDHWAQTPGIRRETARANAKCRIGWRVDLAGHTQEWGVGLQFELQFEFEFPPLRG